MSEVDFGGMAVEVEPSDQFFILTGWPMMSEVDFGGMAVEYLLINFFYPITDRSLEYQLMTG